jgi:NAD(P)-dependent dehydrogenase (short-subunit alcohol dehydrogenase family)
LIPIAQLTEDLFDTFMNVHFKGVCFLTQKTLTMMNDNGGVVFITAAATRFNVPGYSVYASYKWVNGQRIEVTGGIYL